MLYECRNPTRLGPNLIDVEYNHPLLGWVPYTASNSSPYEVDGTMLAIYESAERGDYGPLDAEPA